MLIPGGDRPIAAFLCPSVSLPSNVPPLSFGGSSYNGINTGYATSHYKACRGFCDRGIFLRQAEAEVQQICFAELGGQWVRITKPPFKRVRMQDVKDGTSKTIMAGESAYYTDVQDWPIWLGSPRRDEATLFKTEDAINCNITSRNFPLTPEQQNQALDDDCALSWHRGGAFFVFCDGSVHFIREDIEIRTYNNLGDRMDGEVLDGLFD
jgi:hypothetical protein